MSTTQWISQSDHCLANVTTPHGKHVGFRPQAGGKEREKEEEITV